METSKYLIIPLITITSIACTPKPKSASNLDAVKSADTALIMKTEPATDSAKTADSTITKTDMPPAAGVVTAKQLIVPGKSIGSIHVQESMEKVFDRLGRPDNTDAAMGSSLATWYEGHKPTGYKTAVFSQHNYNGKDDIFQYVQRILVTSPYFKTADGIGAGNTLEQIKQKYTLKPGRNYNSNGATINVFNDLDKGISFEIDPATNKCVGVVVQKAGDANIANINMH